jgi:transcriptional regulator with XRE-family HTH domain
MALTPKQCRAARGWLGWSQQELAARARVGLSTVKLLERGGNLIPATAEAIRRAVEDAGVRPVFGEDGRPTGIVAEVPADNDMPSA